MVSRPGRGAAGRDRGHARRRACPAGRSGAPRAGRRRRRRAAARAGAARSAPRARPAAPGTRACRGGPSPASPRLGLPVRGRAQLAVEAVGRRRAGGRGGEHVAAGDARRAPTPARLTATRCPAPARVHRLVVDLHRAHPHRVRPRAAAAASSPRAIVPRPQRAGHDRPGAADRERRGRRAGAPGAASSARERTLRGELVERGAQLVEAGAGPRRHGHDASPPGAARRPRPPPGSGSARSLLVTATTPASTAERPQHGGVLARLGHHAVVGGDRHQVQVDAASRRRPSCARSARGRGRRSPTDARPEGSDHAGVAELDRDSPRPLLGQAVGVDAGEGADQRRLAVVDVPGGAERERGRRRRSSAGQRGSHRTRRRASPRRRRGCGGRAAAGRPRSGRHRRLAPPQAPPRAARAPAAGERDRRPGQLEQRQRSAADLGHRLDHRRRRADRLRQLPGAARRARPAPPTASPAPGSPAAPRSGSRSSASVASSAASESLSIRSARASGWAAARRRPASRPTSRPAWGPPSSLSPEQHTSAAPAPPTRGWPGSPASAASPIGQQAPGADVVDHRNPELAQLLPPAAR